MSDPKRDPDEHRDLSAIRAASGEDEDREDTPQVEREEKAPDAPGGVRRDADPSRDFAVKGADEPYDTDEDIEARARRNTAAGRQPGTITDPNSVTTGTEVEPGKD